MSQVVDMARVSDATHIAMQFVLDLLHDEHLDDLRIEEFVEGRDGKSWLVTVSFLRPERIQTLPQLSAVQMVVRAYKTVEIEKDTLRPLAMKNKEGE